MDPVSSTLLVLVVLLIGLWIRLRREQFSVFKRNGIPGPEPSFWVGNYKDVAEKKEECLIEYEKKYGSIFGFFIGAKPLLVVTDQELIKTVQVKEFANFIDRDIGLKDMGIPKPEFLHALFPVRGEDWKKLRSLISPTFSVRKLKAIMPIIDEATDIFLEKVRESCSKDHINIVKLLKNVSLDIITKIILGVDTGVQHSAQSTFLDSVRLFLSTSTLDILPALSLCFPETEPLPTKLRYIRDILRYYFGLPAVKSAFSQLYEIISHRRRSERREDILQSLIEGRVDIKQLHSKSIDHLSASNEEKEEEQQAETEKEASSKLFSLSDDKVAANLANLLIAGYDTTNATLSYLVYHLIKNQDVQERLREEIKEQLAGKKGITYEDLSKLRYLEQVISETLRVHPLSMLTITRIAKQPVKYKGMTIPKGMILTIPAYVLHRNPENWPDPEKFEPERFSPENKGAINGLVYQPFGNGPRNCVGKRLAQVVMKTVITKLIRSYKLKCYGDTVKEPETEYTTFINSPRKLLVKIEPISQ